MASFWCRFSLGGFGGWVAWPHEAHKRAREARFEREIGVCVSMPGWSWRKKSAEGSFFIPEDPGGLQHSPLEPLEPFRSTACG